MIPVDLLQIGESDKAAEMRVAGLPGPAEVDEFVTPVGALSKHPQPSDGPILPAARILPSDVEHFWPAEDHEVPVSLGCDNSVPHWKRLRYSR